MITSELILRNVHFGIFNDDPVSNGGGGAHEPFARGDRPGFDEGFKSLRFDEKFLSFHLFWIVQGREDS